MVNRIVTHPGVFHADDVFAVAIVMMANPPLSIDDVFRREPTEEDMMDSSVVVLDIGGEYTPALNNYDHHQRGGAGTRDEMGVLPYASTGLAWNNLILPGDGYVDESMEEEWWKRVDRTLIQGIDAVDCGKAVHSRGVHAPSISECIAACNPLTGATNHTRDSAFAQQVYWAQNILRGFCDQARLFCHSRAMVLNADATLDGQVLMLDTGLPASAWAKHMRDRPEQEKLKFVCMPSARTPGQFVLTNVGEIGDPFKGRAYLPEGLRGLPEDKLREASGIKDAVFVHPNGFCGGAESEAGALDLAALALEWAASRA